MIFFGIADSRIQEVIEFFATKADAEAELEQILRDEPGWASVLSVVAVDFSGEAPQLLATPKHIQ